MIAAKTPIAAKEANRELMAHGYLLHGIYPPAA